VSIARSSAAGGVYGRDTGTDASVDSLAVDLTRFRDVELVDATGAPRRIGSFWEERPVALVFLRHFG
jgi:hypothetical protein